MGLWNEMIFYTFFTLIFQRASWTGKIISPSHWLFLLCFATEVEDKFLHIIAEKS